MLFLYGMLTMLGIEAVVYVGYLIWAYKQRNGRWPWAG